MFFNPGPNTIKLTFFYKTIPIKYFIEHSHCSFYGMKMPSSQKLF